MSGDPVRLDKGILKNLRYDIPSGVVVFLVALPLCLGIALASEAPLMSGLISGMVGGLLVTLVSRSPLSVSGPAAGLASIVAAGIGQVGLEAFFVAALIPRVMQTAPRLLPLGFFSHLFSLLFFFSLSSSSGEASVNDEVRAAYTMSCDELLMTTLPSAS